MNQNNIIMIPQEVINYIYMFNIDHRLKYKLCLGELLQKKYHKEIISDIKLLSFGPLYSVPKLLKRNVNIYPLLYILRK